MYLYILMQFETISTLCQR